MHTKLDSNCHQNLGYVNDQIPSPPALLPHPALPKPIINNYAHPSVSHDMPCLTTSTNYSSNSGSNKGISNNSTDCKSSPYSLWAEYFDNFPVLTEFDLRAGATNSTGSSIASSSINSSSPSTSSEESSWSSPGSGSPFSDCDTSTPVDVSPFDDHSVIDEIVQTLKMDGYNFDHLGDEIIDLPPTNCQQIKQEQIDMCYIPQQPVYMSLNRTKLPQRTSDVTSMNRKLNNCPPPPLNNNYLSMVNYQQTSSSTSGQAANNLSILDQMVDESWSDDLCDGAVLSTNPQENPQAPIRSSIPLPPLSKYDERS